MEMKCIFNIGKNISISSNVTQVSDVAHGPLVYLEFIWSGKFVFGLVKYFISPDQMSDKNFQLLH
jgi:hypothetical protein